MNLSELERAHRADPTNLDLHTQHILAKARSFGPRAFVELLTERLLWNKAPAEARDQAIEVVADLQAGFGSYRGTQIFTASAGSHSLALFESQGSSFVLIPGSRLQGIPPLLVSQSVRTAKQRSIYSEHSLGAARLPTEREWRYLCQAGTKTRYYWGDEFDRRYLARAAPAHLECHPFGLYNMLGGLWERCSLGIHSRQRGTAVLLGGASDSPSKLFAKGIPKMFMSDDFDPELVGLRFVRTLN